MQKHLTYLCSTQTHAEDLRVFLFPSSIQGIIIFFNNKFKKKKGKKKKKKRLGAVFIRHIFHA